MSSSGRAPRLASELRRTAILEAVRPLLLSRGISVTTKELATAAGVAEGTLFRVFPDKASLVREAVVGALDPSSVISELGAIDLALCLEDRLSAAIGLVLFHAGEISAWLSLLRQMNLEAPTRVNPVPNRRHVFPAQRLALRRLLEPDAHRFGIGIDEAVVDLLDLILTGAVMRSMTTLRGAPELALSAPTIAKLVLSGLLLPASRGKEY